jgi:DNA polymerase I-like protein with 3'-5' exonuclease and polymerase domains
VIELTTEQREQVEFLQRELPPIVRNDYVEFVDPVCIDLEWDPKTGALELIGLGNEERVVQIWWNEFDFLGHVQIRAWIAHLVRTVPIVYHNAAADIKKLRQHGFDVTVECHASLDDTMLAHAVLHSEEPHDLEYLALAHGQLPPYKNAASFAPAEYNAADVVSTIQVWNRYILPAFARDPQAEFVYRTMSLPFLALQIEGEEAGIRTNQAQVERLHTKYTAKREAAIRLAWAGAGWPINLGSPDQLKTQLYNVQDLPIQRKKDRSTWPPMMKATSGKDAIATLRRLQGTEWDEDEEPTIEQAVANIEAGGDPVLEARYLFAGAQQALSHYIAPCLGRDRIFSECRQHVQASGRHSYVGTDEPGKKGVALQQLKGRPVDGVPELQLMIVPDEGTVWIGHDWSNIETWKLGALAGDPLILEAKRQGWDTHTVNYCDITGTPYPPVMTKALHSDERCADWRARFKWQGDDDLRRTFAKRYVYRLHYRGDPKNAGDIPGARALGFDAVKLIAASEAYLGKHRPIVEFWNQIEQQIDSEGLVRTFMGRPRRLTSDNESSRYREGSNHPMQGGVADVYITTALLVKRAAPWARLVFGAHDSMWWQVPIARKAEFVLLYVPIVTREFNVNGLAISYPASFKERTAA